MRTRLISIVWTVAMALAVTAGVLACGLRSMSGHWTYALDDAYIHMAMARTLAFHGVWGCSPETWSFCSSSPLWTILLAVCFKTMGVHAWIPGVLNVICMLATLIILDNALFRERVASRWRTLAGVCVFLGAPLTVIASTGMEHCLHVLVSVAFVLSSVSFFRNLEKDGDRRAGVWLCVCAFLSTAVRFESQFFIVPVAVLLVFSRRWRMAIVLLVSGAAPILIHGVYALAHGGFFLPNSLMLKGRFPGNDSVSLIRQVFSMYLGVSLENVHVHILCVLLLVTAGLRHIDRAIRLLAIAVVTACVGHVTLSFCGRFYRYEIYLMAMGIVVLTLAWFPRDPMLLRERLRVLWGEDRWMVAARSGLLLFLLLPLALRGIWATGRIVRASTNIYEQQAQVARIFGTFDLQGCRLAINDLGYIAYRSGVEWVDLWGLGTPEVARLKVAGRYDGQAIAEILSAKRVGYLAVYNAWFAPGRELPLNVILVAKLRNRRNLVCLEDTVMLYATGPAEGGRLASFLRNLPFELPEGTELELIEGGR